ncbi:C-Myc-binding protein [Harpegnathos saltator]|uniref:c-Myc-binding protein n=1 Tax=Harpegnathos saltator TaxID=610380 RepID=E2BY70_HARSA|nr:C-Myc-binding protein [Harpegnathos saltator]
MDFRERTTTSIHVRPPTVACVALSNTARSGALLPYLSPRSPSIEQAPIAHVKIPIDIKREEFRKYLERSGVIEGLTKVLVMLYEEPEKPTDALEYVRKHLGGVMEDTSEVDTLKKELDDAKAKITELKSKLVKYEIEEATDE